MLLEELLGSFEFQADPRLSAIAASAGALALRKNLLAMLAETIVYENLHSARSNGFNNSSKDAKATQRQGFHRRLQQIRASYFGHGENDKNVELDGADYAKQRDALAKTYLHSSFFKHGSF